MSNGLVISDLHLFSRRSRAEELLAGMQGEIIAADILVLNGDVFDFRWSALPDMRATIDASLNWLDGLIGMRAGKPTHYLLGNHDCVTGFTEQLSGFAQARTSLSCHESFLHLGRNLFLHGDCANRRMDGESLRRFRETWSRDKQRGPMGRTLYDAADALGASRKVHDLWFPQGVTVRRVAHHLNHILPGWREEIDHCYFGHTHLPFTRHSYEGVMFHNTGSAIRDMVFQPLAFTCPAGAATS
jgi:UDP-2,3-diacylglucosamine pyrophosphatase LpxH